MTGHRGARAGTRARHATLMQLLRDGVTSVEELSERAGVSASTVRRDLARLREDGEVARTYGGAMVAPFHERSVRDSARHRLQGKSAIARLAVSQVPAGGRVFVDAGTTCGALARLVAADPELGPLTVVTRGLETAVALADSRARRAAPARRPAPTAQPRRGRAAGHAGPGPDGVRRRVPRRRRRRRRSRSGGADRGGDDAQGAGRRGRPAHRRARRRQQDRCRRPVVDPDARAVDPGHRRGRRRPPLAGRRTPVWSCWRRSPQA